MQGSHITIKSSHLSSYPRGNGGVVFWCYVGSRRAPSPSISILPFDILLHAPPHLDQTAPDLLKKRNNLVDIRIAHRHDWSERSASPAMAANRGTYSVRPSTARLRNRA